MILCRCYRDGGAELFIVIPTGESEKFITMEEWLIRLNQLAHDPKLPSVSMFIPGREVRPGVFEFPNK